MSGSRSIAAARNRRAGTSNTIMTQQSNPQIQQNRPNTRIAQTQQNQPYNIQQQQPLSQYQNQMNQKQNVVPNASSQQKMISVSDAIWLICARLNKLETASPIYQNNNSLENILQSNDSVKLVDESIILSMIERLDNLENKPSQPVDTSLPIEIKSLKDKNLALVSNLTSVKNELKQTKSELSELKQMFFELKANLESMQFELLNNDQYMIEDTENIINDTAENNDPIINNENNDDVTINTPNFTVEDVINESEESHEIINQ
jgi:FtsZ-binding cell division protein ZapB